MPALRARPTGVRLAPVLTIDGAALSIPLQRAFVEARVTRAVRTVGTCVLRFLDPEFELARSGDVGLGADVTVTASADTAASRSVEVFSGQVTGVAIETDHQGRAELHVTVQDRGHQLARASRTVAYLDSGYLDIVRQVASRAGLSASPETSGGSMHPYVLQAGTDLDMIDELTGRMSLDWVVDGSTVRVWSPAERLSGPVSATLRLGEDTTDLSVRLTSSAASTVTVRGSDPDRSELVTATSTRRAPSSGITQHFAPKKAGEVSLLDTANNPLTSLEATEIAEAVLASDGNVVLRCSTLLEPGIEPGRTVEVKDAGPVDGRYYVREVTHSFTEHGARTQVVAGDRPRSGLRDAIGGDRGRAASGLNHGGLVVGKVSDVDDPKNLGRVKVTFEVLAQNVTSGWARVASPGAGPGRGLLALPEIDDEVLLGFESTDVRRPVVLGGLHGPKSLPPSADRAQKSGTVVTRALTSRLGHSVELSDGPDDATRHVLLSLDGATHRLRIGKDRADLQVPSGVPLTISAGSSTIAVDDRGAISISGTSVTVEASAKLSLKAPEIDIAATAKVSISGATAELASQGSTTVKSAGMTAVSGATVMIN